MTLAYLRRKHRCLWIALEFMEPHGVRTWQIVAVGRTGNRSQILARAPFCWLAILRALCIKVVP